MITSTGWLQRQHDVWTEYSL